MRSKDHDALHAADGAEALRAAIAALRASGERVTKPRRTVLEVLASHSRPLSADEVAVLLEHASVHRATVYRTLERLVEIGLVSTTQVTGAASRYHLTATGSAHDHLHGHCRSCGSIVPLPVDAFAESAVQLQRVTGFSLDAEQSVFAGLCDDCAVPASA